MLKFRPISPLGVVLCLSLGTVSLSHAGWLQQGQALLESSSGKTDSMLGEKEIASGLKEALRVGSGRVVDQLGAVDGFNADPSIHIPLPDDLLKVRSTLTAIGMGGMLDELELKLNRAAEVATPKAKRLFLKAIEGMTLEDVGGIYNGPQDAATRYFEQRMSTGLQQEMQPLVDASLAEVGAIQSYEAVLGEYQKLPFVPNIRADLSAHVIELGSAGIFHYLAEEEAAIRANPAKRTTELLQKVFATP